MPAVDWDALPEPVRGRLVEYAAAALSDLSRADVPPRLRPVARFAPAKRARVAAAALLSSLAELATFRVAVLAWLEEHRPGALRDGQGDAVAEAAAAVLREDDAAADAVRSLAAQVEEAGLRAERDAALARIQRLEVELAEVRREAEEARASLRSARGDRDGDLDKLRGRLREQGVQLRKARDAEASAREELAGAAAAESARVADLTARLEKERLRADGERARADRAHRAAEDALRSVRQARDADDIRLALLTDTIAAAVDGLRAELGIKPLEAGAAARPADTVALASPGASPAKAADAAVLDRLLALPTVHLVVDGYNVTKTGYPDLPLAEQRERLGRQLSALAARTSAEVTVVFDGAGVVSVPVTSVRGVRVLFSDPGVQADDVIRAIVAAEPRGRPIVVATSDQEVVSSVRERGAHPVPSAVLVARLGRV